MKKNIYFLLAIGFCLGACSNEEASPITPTEPISSSLAPAEAPQQDLPDPAPVVPTENKSQLGKAIGLGAFMVTAVILMGITAKKLYDRFRGTAIHPTPSKPVLSTVTPQTTINPVAPKQPTSSFWDILPPETKEKIKKDDPIIDLLNGMNSQNVVSIWNQAAYSQTIPVDAKGEVLYHILTGYPQVFGYLTENNFAELDRLMFNLERNNQVGSIGAVLYAIAIPMEKNKLTLLESGIFGTNFTPNQCLAYRIIKNHCGALNPTFLQDLLSILPEKVRYVKDWGTPTKEFVFLKTIQENANCPKKVKKAAPKLFEKPTVNFEANIHYDND